MGNLFLLAVAVVVLVIIVAVLKVWFGGDEQEEKPKYQYKRRNFFLSRAEHQFYDVLVTAVGAEYLIFPQVHLPTILDHQVKGQSWYAARAHINRKSVDFVLCDKAYISPKLAIELDDKSHERPERQERDKEVERIFHEVGLPLLRVKNDGNFVPGEISLRIKALALK